MQGSMNMNISKKLYQSNRDELTCHCFTNYGFNNKSVTSKFTI